MKRILDCGVLDCQNLLVLLVLLKEFHLLGGSTTRHFVRHQTLRKNGVTQLVLRTVLLICCVEIFDDSCVIQRGRILEKLLKIIGRDIAFVICVDIIKEC